MHAGFAQFLGSSGVTAFLDAVVRHEEQEGKTDSLDTHPSLRERVAALADLPWGDAGDTRRASALLSDVSRWEREVLGASTGPGWARDLKPLAWAEVAEKVHLPIWRERVDRHGYLLRDYTIGTLPTTRSGLVRIGGTVLSGLEQEEEREISDDDRLGHALRLIVAATAVRLLPLGWSAETQPGYEVVLRRNGHELRPYGELQAIAEQQAGADCWRARCVALGIADLPLWGSAVGV